MSIPSAIRVVFLGLVWASCNGSHPLKGMPGGDAGDDGGAGRGDGPPAETVQDAAAAEGAVGAPEAGAAEVLAGGDDRPDAAAEAPRADAADARDPASCPCTRRPGEGNSFMCRMGVNESMTFTIGPGGGYVIIHGRQGTPSNIPFALNIPPTALPGEVSIKVTETNLPPPGDFVDFSPVYRIEPTTLAFSVPVEVQIPWSSTLTLVPAQLAIYWSAPDSDTTFVKVPDSSVGAGVIRGSTRGGGYAFVGVPKGTAFAGCP
jgi:hypothetical protein